MSVLRGSWDLIPTLRHASRRYLAALITASLLAALLPTVSAVVTGWLVEGVIQAVGGRAHGEVWLMFAAFVGVTVAGWAATALIPALSSVVGLEVDGAARDRLAFLAGRPRMFARLESAAVADDVSRVTESTEGSGRCLGPGAMTQLENLFKLLSIITLCTVIGQASTVLAVLLFVMVLATRQILLRGLSAGLSEVDEQARARRRGRYLQDLACTAASAKEVRTFGLGAWLVDRFSREMHEYHQSLFMLRRGMARREALLLPVLIAVTGAAFYWPAVSAMHGRITVSVATAVLMASVALFTSVQVGQGQMYITPARLALQAQRRIELLEVDLRPPGSASAALQRARAPAIRFTGVWFGYTEGAPVLNGIDLEIKPGEVLAIVGMNGAGKTTLTKLLAGLLEPQHGRITADGIDICTLDPAHWTSCLAVVFQDFLKYQLSARDNISLASPAHAGNEGMIRAAIEKAGAAELLARLPEGLDTPLSRERTGGVDLSGGQWQKIAIARALFAVAAGARVLVLDEPTAHLDIRAEQSFFAQVVNSITGVSVILISHRLSTVRQADRIVLMDGGRITESGTHDELVALNGQYGEMFALQAARFAGMYAGGDAR